jgi:sugar lactone lactonase YvrE
VSLGQIEGIALDAFGNVFVADTENSVVGRIAANGLLTIMAGNGIAGYSGDGGPATSASLNSPRGIAIDGLGNLYIADCLNHRVRKVNSAGIITTIAGSGSYGFGGDGGLGVTAQLNQPLAVAVDVAGNLYIADSQNQRLRKISSNGIITTVAGNGTGGYSGDGGPGPSGSIFLPSGLTLDSKGNVYFTTVFGLGGVGPPATIRELDSDGILSTVAEGVYFSGSGSSSGLTGPIGIALDAAGNVYFADASQSYVGEVTTSGGRIEFVGTGRPGFSGDGGPASAAELFSPFGVTADAVGNLYITDSGSVI